MKEYICIDIGGTSIKHGLFAQERGFLTTGEVQTAAAKCRDPGIMEKVQQIADDYCNAYKPQGICVSTAGMVDCEQGKITYACPLIPHYSGTEVKKILESRFGLPCEVENDVNCAALAEYFAGASRGSSSSLCLTIGTGIGGAAIINGKVWHGYAGSGCEVGYMHLKEGTFQDLGASSVLVKKVSRYKNRDTDTIDGKYVFEHAKKGDMDCIRAIDEMVDVLGMGIANICYVLNPEVVVLGGGIMAQQDYLEPRIRASLEKYLIPSILQYTRLAFAHNQNQAGMLGAYYHFQSKHGNPQAQIARRIDRW